MNQIAMYMRLSKEDLLVKEESNSITNQRFLIKQYIYSNPDLSKYKLVEYYDDGYSGTNFNRPGIQKLLESVKQDQVLCIVVKDFSRFSRDYIELGSYIDQIFPFMGIRFISINDNYDSINHKGITAEIDTTFKTLLYDFYSKDLSVKVKNSIVSKCEKGEYAFGQLPFGYERIPDSNNQIRLNKRETEVVRRVFDLALAGMSTTQIAKQLNKDKVLTCKQMRNIKINRDKPPIWGTNGVRSILRNRFYIGEWAYNKTHQEIGGKKYALPKEEWKIVKNHHEPLVSDEEFIKAQPRKSGISTKRKYDSHPLTGKVYCGACGYSMVYKSHTKYKRFECVKHSITQNEDCCTYMNETLLKEIVLSMLTKEMLKLLSLDESQNAWKEIVNEQIYKIRSYIKELKIKIKGLELSKQKQYELYATGESFVEAYQITARKVESEVQQLVTELEVSNETLQQLEDQYLQNYNDLKPFLRHNGVIKLTSEVVELFVKRINLYKGKRIEIKWNFKVDELDNNVTPNHINLAMM